MTVTGFILIYADAKVLDSANTRLLFTAYLLELLVVCLGRFVTE